MSVLDIIMAAAGGNGAAVDPYFSSVTALLEFNGANGSQTLLDSGPLNKTITAGGNAQISTSSPLHGSGALICDGAGDYASFSCTFNPSASNWTLEGFVNPNGAENLAFVSDALSTNFYLLRISGSVYLGDGLVNTITTAFSLTSGVYTHWALVKNGSSYTFYVGGAIVATTTVALASNAIGSLSVGGYNQGYWLLGKMDSFRFTQGVARYTTTFTPPTDPFPTS